MTTDNQNLVSVSIPQMRAYLKSIGFERFGEVGKSTTFRHLESGTIVTLTQPMQGDLVRAADFLSIKIRLATKQLVSEDAVATFNQGRLPIAS